MAQDSKNTKILTEANVVNRSPETSDKEGGLQEPAPEYTPRDDLFSQDATEEQKALAREALADLGRLGIHDRRAKPRLLGSRTLAEFAEKKTSGRWHVRFCVYADKNHHHHG